MTDWDWLIGDAVIGSILPPEYARYRRPVVEGLRHFLGRLRAGEIAGILAGQAALGPTATAEERLVDLAERCPVLHKIGQVLARDRRLSAELRRHLQRLESLPPTTPVAAIEAVLAAELGRLDRLGVTLEPPALAEASVAVVIPFSRHAGPEPRRGVFKVLRPGIEEKLSRELRSLEDIGAFLDDSCARFEIPALEYREVFEQVRESLVSEVDLAGEQDHLRRAAAIYADAPDVVIPRVLPYCSPRVTAMEWVDGRKVTDAGPLSPGHRRRLAEVVIESLIAAPALSTDEDAIFHADPHAGNLLATPDRRLAILDWSLAGRLGRGDRAAMTQVMLGGLTLDPGSVRDGLRGLSADGRLDDPALAAVTAEHLRTLRHGGFPGFSWLMGLVDDAVLRARLRAHSGLMLFRKVLHTLEGVVADISPDVQADRVLPAIFLRRFVSEIPARLAAPYRSRRFGTGLSNEDLAILLVQLSSTPARAFVENTLELLAALGGRPEPGL
ncbi:putative protein kinase UbiB [Aquisphaera giovannonii]|uniref:ABC1 atypical kinase-like domain-containing protein n=1 Tax=Aquisphaera giovannonii TaxID=406548 RepID=A0A5B9W0Y0_9BACT|nr:AarF/ABC1/UbiB kinase family protein [Aquisphaera giovannonii]QEH33901.1 putative protein kinase UbiB [Aquisphaera giovannonii]